MVKRFVFQKESYYLGVKQYEKEEQEPAQTPEY